ncbi:MAG: hypothetical protein OHK0029_13120 [Armatimonadaceae bacterium]
MGEQMSDFWNRIQALNGKTLKTRIQGKPFDILEVRSDWVIISPHTSGKRRTISRSCLEHINSLQLDERELTPSRLQREYSDDQNLSYIAAIIGAIREES